jgi:hypothetical protein
MTYGLNARLFVENGPAIRAAEARSARHSSDLFRAWRALDADRRLALVEEVLRPACANDDGHGLPIAL